MKRKITLHGREVALEAVRDGDLLRVSIDGGAPVELRLLAQEGGRLVLARDGRLIHVAGHSDGDRRQLWVDGQIVQYSRVAARRSAAAEQSGGLAATIPAVVSALLVAVGDHVQAGDKLILLESMKMVIPIAAPTAGTVRAIYCAAGDAVQPGVPLLALDDEA